MTRTSPIRYAVVGLGYFAQAAVLPAFARLKHSELRAIVSGDAEKLRVLGDKYDVKHRVAHSDIDALLRSGEVDAVYIALPNSHHAETAIRAASAGVHVLCEKPMALNERECVAMVDAAAEANVHLMVGYRLHFEAANLAVVEAVTRGEIGEPRYFNASFSMQVVEGNTRLQDELGGGPLHDIGIYCINASRYVFRDEPTDVAAMTASHRGDSRFNEVDEQVSVLMRFPGDRLATFIASFGAAHVSRYEVVGTRGVLRLQPAFDHASALKLELEIDGKRTRRTFAKRDQVAAEIEYFSDCIASGTPPQPSGSEGLADVRIMRAITESARTHRTVAVEPIEVGARPEPKQQQRIAPHGMPKLVHAAAPSR